ncbi:hypothetical protein Tco_0579031 [Tanacetum coccineum]
MDNPYSRNFEEYKEEFDDEIKQLENEYELKAGRNRYTLEEVWEKCEKTFEGTNGNGNPKEIHNAKAQDNEGDMDPLTPQTVYITPSGNDYVAPATNPMSNKQLNKFEKEFSNITKGDEKEYDNPVIETYDFENFIQKLLHQVSQSSREMKSQQQYGSNLSFPYPLANHGVYCYSHLHLISSEGRNTLLLGKYGWSQARDSNKNKRFVGGTP